jgi:hypothetical protein
MTRLTKTQAKLMEQAKSSPRGMVVINFANRTTFRSKNSFGLRERQQADKLVKLGLLIHEIDLSEYSIKTGAGTAVFSLANPH